MRIGELAAHADLSPDTIRYYERLGLLGVPARTAGGYRDYAADAVDDLSFIRKAQTLGLRLSEIREIMEIAAGGRAPCEHVRGKVQERLMAVELRLAELRALRSTLKETLARLDRVLRTEGCRCVVIESL